MGRKYTAVFDNVAITAGQDFFEITPAANKPVKVYGLFIGQSSDVGDAEEEIVRYSFIRGYTTSGSGGTTPTPRPNTSSSDTAAGAVVEVNNTTAATGGTPHTLHADTFNVRTGLQLWLPEGAEHYVSAATGSVRLCIRLLAAPTDSLTTSGTVYFEELI